MKFIKDMPAYGTTRIRKEFLLMPLTLVVRPAVGQDTIETRWLEVASWEEEWMHSRWTHGGWSKRRWLS